jgi:hypothetical protein
MFNSSSAEAIMPQRLWTILLLAFTQLLAPAFGGSPPLPLRPADRDLPQARPVVLELFTSEGCSSCPPADAFLKQLDDKGHIDDVEVIAIEEHVDYWDRLGWTDPFSSRDWTERQQQYASSFRLHGVYTPQLVVNGSRELVGNSAREARQKILEASKLPGADLRLSIDGASSKTVDFSINVSNVPAEAGSAQLWLAVTERNLSSHVLRGENEGRNLAHAAILRKLVRVKRKQLIPQDSAQNKAGSEEFHATVPLDAAWKRENLRFVVFLQEPKTLHIVGAAASSLSH